MQIILDYRFQTLHWNMTPLSYRNISPLPFSSQNAASDFSSTLESFGSETLNTKRVGKQGSSAFTSCAGCLVERISRIPTSGPSFAMRWTESLITRLESLLPTIIRSEYSSITVTIKGNPEMSTPTFCRVSLLSSSRHNSPSVSSASQ